jgi:hypothetical protein
MQENIIRFFLKIQSQLQLLHWQTTSFARHEAFGKTYEALGDLIDTFVEVYQGQYGRIFLENKMIEINNINDDEVAPFVDESIGFLKEDLTGMLIDTDTDLLNIRDELIAQFNKLKYLLTLK